MNQENQRILHNGIRTLKLSLNDTQIKQLADYADLLLHWNKRFNLVGKSTEEQFVSRHLLDSLSIVGALSGERWIDVGTGAGLPGIVLAIACPHVAITLLDSNGKKTRFLSQVVYDLSLPNVTVIQDRAEQHNPEQQYDRIISRAYAAISKGLKETSHLGNNESVWCFMKGLLAEQELREIPKPFTLHVCSELAVPGCDGQRHLVELKCQPGSV